MKLNIGKFPIEVFGHTYQDNSTTAKNNRKTQFVLISAENVLSPEKVNLTLK